jgi:deoxyribodipyrimidine photolyase-related protein
MSACTLVFPFQLFDPHPAIRRERLVVLLEDSLIFGDPHVSLRFHQQKMVLHRASMKEYASKLKRRGFDLRYCQYHPGQTICEHLDKLGKNGFEEFHLCDPVDFLLEKRLRRHAEERGARLVFEDTPMFLSPKEWLADHFATKRKPFMAKFYEGQRKRLNVLVDTTGRPEGGRWSFDDENRKPMPKSGLKIPPDPASSKTKSIREAIAYVKYHYADYNGNADTFSYPVTHVSAKKWLQRFFEQRFHQFGPYEDAISRREPFLFHSVLAPMLNIGLLTPRQILDNAIDYAEENNAPLNSLEGFVRQIIGWREFVRGAYDHLGVRCRNGNFWGFEDRPIPAAFYDATTGIDPIDTTIRRVLDRGYCHHIERLMILGNFMLLCGFHPDRVYAWFMELFVDAYDWVMVPNVYGMSQFADGGLFTTKPYISGSNYVRRMSDYPKGKWCEIWDGLFWSFIKNHEDFFRSQHRLGMMVRQIDLMDPAKLKQHLSNARQFLERLH